MKPSFVINIRASKNISGLLKVTVASPAVLMNFFLNVEPCMHIQVNIQGHHIPMMNFQIHSTEITVVPMKL